MRAGPRAALSAAVLGLELTYVVVTGGQGPFGAVGPVGFALRLLVLAALLAVARPRPLLIWLLLLPAVAQFHGAGGRLGGDGVMYYVQARSLYKDADLDLTDEYAHYGLLERPELRVTTRTGLRRTVFAIGPAVVSAPFFALGEAVGRVEAALGRAADLSGYGSVHTNAVALGGLLFGFASVWLVHALLVRHFAPAIALLAALVFWGGTFLHWYMVHQPAMSHAASTAAAALVLWRWDRDRETRGVAGFAGLGLIVGLAMCVRWQNAVFLLLPAIDLARRWRASPSGGRRLAARAAALAVGALTGALPQLIAWKALFGTWLLLHPPQGTEFVRLSRPFLLETLFSSRHGLLSWTPVLWAGYLGFGPLVRRRPALAWPLVPPLALMTYVNACSGDWWAGGSFSNRRFDSLLPVLALGVAAALEVAAAGLRRRPGIAVGVAAAPFIVANVLVGEQVQRGMLSRDDTVAFPSLVGGSAQVLADAVGSPPTWPASWLFALRHNLSPGRYDRMVGPYLFFKQNNLGGVIDIGAPADDLMLADGWGPVEEIGEVRARRLAGRARLFAPLDLPEPLELKLTAGAVAEDATVEVSVNGERVGLAAFGRGWSERAWSVPATVWRRDLNEVAFGASAPVLVDRVRFLRAGDSHEEASPHEDSSR
jgi:hypothetical protein